MRRPKLFAPPEKKLNLEFEIDGILENFGKDKQTVSFGTSNTDASCNTNFKPYNIRIYALDFVDPQI
jgi:hypothetical protein